MTPMEEWRQLNLVTMNMSGRFSAREIKRYGQEVLQYIVEEKDVSIFFGQQMNFRPILPRHFEYIGFNKASLVYNRKLFKACDDKMYKKFLRDMELRGKLHRHYLPETNYVVCKMQMRKPPYQEFIVISWLTDEVLGKLRSTSIFRKLLIFVADLTEVEEMPVIVAGTFRITLDDAKTIIKNDCVNNFRCYGYRAATPRRAMRESDFFLCSRPLRLEDVKPLVCAKMDLVEDPGSHGRWINPEDVFYWDPVISSMWVRPPTPPPPRKSLFSVPRPSHASKSRTKMVPPILTKVPTAPGGSSFQAVPAPLSASSETLKTAPGSLFSRYSGGYSSNGTFSDTLPKPRAQEEPPKRISEIKPIGSSSMIRPLGERPKKFLIDEKSDRDTIDAAPQPGLKTRIPSYEELYDEELVENNSPYASYQRQIPMSKRYMALTMPHKDILRQPSNLSYYSKANSKYSKRPAKSMENLQNNNSNSMPEKAKRKSGQSIDSRRGLSYENLIDFGPETDEESNASCNTDDSEGGPPLRCYFDNDEPFVIEL